jgi:hypothetical protein
MCHARDQPGQPEQTHGQETADAMEPTRCALQIRTRVLNDNPRRRLPALVSRLHPHRRQDQAHGLPRFVPLSQSERPVRQADQNVLEISSTPIDRHPILDRTSGTTLSVPQNFGRPLRPRASHCQDSGSLSDPHKVGLWVGRVGNWRGLITLKWHGFRTHAQGRVPNTCTRTGMALDGVTADQRATLNPTSGPEGG